MHGVVLVHPGRARTAPPQLDRDFHKDREVEFKAPEGARLEDAEQARLLEFADRLVPYLDALPKAFRYAVEIRNKFWLKPWLLDLLRERNIALVLLDLAYMPHPDALTDLNLITTDFTFVRLIGDRKAVDKRTDTFDKIVLDQSGRISRWAKLLQTFMSEVPVAYVYANNHYAGHGPATIRQLVDLLPAEMTSHD